MEWRSSPGHLYQARAAFKLQKGGGGGIDNMEHTNYSMHGSKRPMGLDALLIWWLVIKRSSCYVSLVQTESIYLKWLQTNSQVPAMLQENWTLIHKSLKWGHTDLIFKQENFKATCKRTVGDFIPEIQDNSQRGHIGFQIKLKSELAGSCSEILFAHSISISVWLFDKMTAWLLYWMLTRRVHDVTVVYLNSCCIGPC